jgi:hypothetical protein
MKQSIDKETLKQFADNYTSADFNRIKYDWNGKYGNEFHDNNYDFRMQLAESIISNLNNVKLELIKDLYLEIGKSSEATFGVYTNFHLLAQELLQRGGADCLLVYIRGAAHTMDTALSSGRITLSKEFAQKLLDYFDWKKKTTENAEEQKLLNDYIRQRLEYHANK